MNIQSIILLFFIIGNLILGLAIYRNNPKSWTNRLFTFLIILLTIYLTINSQLYVFDEKVARLFFSRLIISLGALINYAVFMFLATFPRDKIILQKKYFYLATIVTILLFFSGFTNLIFADVRVENNILVPVPGLLMPLFLIHTIGLVFGGIISAIFRLKKSSGIEKIKIRFVMASFFILFSLIIALNFILAVFFQNGDFVPLLPIYIFIFNLLIAYAIVKHRLLNIKPIVARAVLYILLLIVLVTIYATLVFGLVQFLPISINRDYVFIVMAIIVAFSFNTIKNLLEKVTNRILFRSHYETEKLLSKLTQVMATELKVEKLSNKLLTILTQEMRLTRGAFILIENNKIQNIEQLNFPEESLDNDELIQFLKGNQNNYIFEELADESIKNLFRKLKISVILPLKVKNTFIGLLILGQKSSGDIYNNQDLDLLEIIAPQAAIALQNAESYRKIKRFNRTLERKVEERTEELRKIQDKALLKAKQLLKIKDEFVFIATHDLGTPVTAIKGFTYLLEKDKNLSKYAKENISALKESSDRLSKLTNDLLQVARSESKMIKIKTTNIDIISLIKSILKEVSPYAKEHGIKLDGKFHAKKCMVMADEKKLSEVMENLLSNAIKYNKNKGSVTVTTKLVKDKLQVDVADTGLGIPEKSFSKVFQKFSRLNQPGTENTPGTGLGLFVVRMMVEKMKGKISFTSIEGKETTFSFVLPLASKKLIAKSLTQKV